MKEKVKILCYECKKCNKWVYFRTDEEYTTQCKTCKNEMQFIDEKNYKPKNGLSAIKNSNFNNSSKSKSENNIPKCPTCSSTNVKKISSISKVAGAVTFGLFSKTAKSQFKCNNCGYKW